MKGGKRGGLGLAVFFIVVVASVALLLYNPVDISQLWKVSLWGIFILIVIVSISSIVSAYKLKTYTDHYNLKLDFNEWWSIGNLTSMYNMILPMKGGAALRAAYLKKYKNLDISSSLTIHFSSGIVSFFLYGFLTLLFVMIILTKHQVPHGVSLIIFLVAAMLGLAVLFIVPKLPKSKYKIVNYGISIVNQWCEVRRNKRIISTLFVLEFIIWLQFVVRYYIEFTLLGAPVTILGALVIASLVGLSSVISILPTGLGVREAVIVLMSELGGSGLGHGLLVAILDRIIVTFVTLVMGMRGFWWLRKKHFKND
jgi:uncharacterized membrane protein YbhN (UPF0104 family)